MYGISSVLKTVSKNYWVNQAFLTVPKFHGKFGSLFLFTGRNWSFWNRMVTTASQNTVHPQKTDSFWGHTNMLKQFLNVPNTCICFKLIPRNQNHGLHRELEFTLQQSLLVHNSWLIQISLAHNSELTLAANEHKKHLPPFEHSKNH